MTRLYFYTALAAALAILCGAAIVLAETVRRKNRVIRELRELVRRQNRSIGALLKHQEELSETRRGRDGILKKIQEAKSDEEVSDIGRRIAELNNGRLRDAPEG